MLRLDQIEARTPIGSAPFTITNPGSYYVTANLAVSSGDAIRISADNVGLDLNGFTISSTAPSANGIAIDLIGARRNISIANGFISSGVTNNGGTFNGGGFGYGIDYTNAAPSSVRVDRVSVTGCLYYGIYLGMNSTVVASCIADTIGDTGLGAGTVSDSTALNCGTTGISANYANNCNGWSLGSGYGIYALNAYNCNGSGATGTGLYAANVAANCGGGTTVSGTGIQANTANNCVGYSPNGAAISAVVATGCYGTANVGWGISCSGAALNCYGSCGSGYGGVTAPTAQNCYGYSGDYRGINATVAINCYGASNTGVGIDATIGVSCYGTSNSGMAESVAYKYNMP
jgi:hypothetical protein